VSDDDKYHNRSTLECSYPEPLVGGFMFPDSIESKYIRDDYFGRGDYVIFHETSKVRLKSVNEVIPASRFSLADAGLPAGTPVNGNAIPPELNKPYHHIQWDGRALVPVSNEELILTEDDKN
jgi:hypothetical protein